MLRYDNVVGISAIIAAATFVLKYIIDSIISARRARIEREKLMLALYTEVSLNVRVLAEGTRTMPSFHDISAFMAESPAKIPHFTYKYYNDIYKSRSSLVVDLPDLMIKNIISFYGSLEYIQNLIAGLEKKSFQTISQKGRESLMIEFSSSLGEARSSGEKLMDAFRLLQPKIKAG